MSQTIRQQARRQALDVAAKRRRELRERERRLKDLTVQVLTAIGERDAAIAETERRAGQAIREMIEREGVSLGDAVEWFDGQVSLREATRLRRLVDGDEPERAELPAKRPSAVEGGGEGAGTAAR